MDYKLKYEQETVKTRLFKASIDKYKIELLSPLFKDLEHYIGKEVYFKNQLLGYDPWSEDCIDECNDVVRGIEKLPIGLRIIFNSGKYNIVRADDKYTIFTLQH